MGPDDERRTLFVSPHAEALLGYPRQEWLDQPDIWQELLHPDDREVELAAHDRHNETGEPWQREYRLIASDGRQVWVSDRAELVPGPEGRRWLGVMLDITPQKDAEAMLRLSKDDLELRVLDRTAALEEANEMMSLEIGERRRIEAELRAAQDRYRTIVEGLPAAVYAWETNWANDEDPPEIEHYTSPQVERILGFQVAEWHAPGFWKTRVHPHDRDRIVELADRSATTGEPFSAEYRYLAADGRIVWVLDRATLRTRNARGEPRLFQGVMLDITDLKRAQEEAMLSEQRFRTYLERGPVGGYVYDVEPGDPPSISMRYVSPKIGEIVGYPVSHWEGHPEVWLEMTHPDDRQRLVDAFSSWITGEPWSFVYRVIGGDGNIVWLLDRGSVAERGPDGAPRTLQGVIVDVTELKESQRGVEVSEAQLRSVVESLPAAPWIEVTEPDSGRSHYVFIGPHVVELFGYTPDDLMMEPDHFFRLVHPDDRERMRQASDRCDRTGEPWDELYRVVHRDGSLRWILSYATRTVEQDRPVWHGISFDVTRHVEAGTIRPPALERSDVDAP
jgi:PAS domain S-box-containing protein